MKVTRKDAPIVVPPPTFVLELTQEEALLLKDIVWMDETIPAEFSAAECGKVRSFLHDLSTSLTDAGVV